MKNITWKKFLKYFIFIFLCFFNSTFAASSFKLSKIENCTTITDRATLERCDVKNDELNFVFYVKNPLKTLSFNLSLFKIDKSRVRQIIHTPKFDWCQLISKTSKTTSPFLQAFLVANMDKIPMAMKKCPIKGKIELLEIAPTKSLFTVMPIGSYRMKAEVYDDMDTSFFIFSIKLDIF
ncbi:hypothetical protein PVAND_016516 [Polypedilum vanderplanki]|uniref:MD-2-related lipid-recognition domain-containing protein n=1 Tax=Polypedilum vanderplanki TaxID=319348 RepID=A0A9J6BGE8_POLVA|nr:hypothetical protein PVAND_016516 [Polypedilum vanderplanki]